MCAEKDLYRLLFESSNEAILLVEDGQIIEGNPSAAALFGGSREDLVGQTLLALSSADQPGDGESQQVLPERLENALAGEKQRFEWVCRRLDAQTFPARVTLRRVDLGAARRLLQISVQDMTEYKEAGDQLRRLSQVVEQSPSSIVITNTAGEIEYVNPKFTQVTGYTLEEAQGANPRILKSGEKPSEEYRTLWETILAGKEWHGEFHNKKKNGELFWEYASISPIISGSGEITHFLAIKEDITERKRAEEELLQSRQRLALHVQQAPLAVIEWNPNFEVLDWNPAAEKIFGYSKEEAVGRHVAGLIVPASVKEIVDQVMEELVQNKGGTRSTNENITKSGRIIVCEWYNTPLVDESGRVIGVTSLAQDVTEQHRLEEEIKASLERRGRQVRLSTQVAQEIATATDLRDLYQQVVNRVSEQFGYYYAQLLRYDPVANSLVLVAGSGEAGDKMLAKGHSMALGEGLIGTAAADGAPVLRTDVTQDPDWQPNSLLPETKGELAAPIKSGDEVLGVLDVQSDVVGALDEEDQLALEGLCGQIAVAIESTRLHQDMEERLQELNALQRLMSREAWQEFATGAAQAQGYLFDQIQVRPVDQANLSIQANDQAQPDPAAVSDQSDVRPVIAPLAVRGEVIGGLGIYDDPNRPVSAEDQALLESISAQVAEAMERVRLLEQTQKRAVELEAVAQVGTAAATILSTEKLLQTVADLTKVRFGLYHAHIYLLDEAGAALVLAAGAGEPGRKMAAQGWQIALNHKNSIVALTARNRQGNIVNDVRQAPNFLPNPLLPDTRSEMAVPLIVGEQLLGVLDVQSDHVNRFTNEDLRIKSTLAAQIAVALQNARLYQQTQTTLAETERLYTAAQAISAARNEQEIVAALVERIDRSRLDRVTVALLDESQEGQLVGEVKGNWDRFGQEQDLRGKQFTADEIPLIEQLGPEETLLIDDFATSDQIDEATRAIYKEFGVKSAAILPISTGQRLLGWLFLETTQAPRYFATEEIRPYMALAGQAAVAIQTARLFQQTQARARREQILREITARVRGSIDPDVVVRTAVTELSQALGRPAFVRLGSAGQFDPSSPPDSDGQANGKNSDK